MKTLTILIILALAATVVSMIVGVGSMGRGGTFDDRHSGQFMNARIISQTVAVVLLIVALLIG